MRVRSMRVVVSSRVAAVAAVDGRVVDLGDARDQAAFGALHHVDLHLAAGAGLAVGKHVWRRTRRVRLGLRGQVPAPYVEADVYLGIFDPSGGSPGRRERSRAGAGTDPTS